MKHPDAAVQARRASCHINLIALLARSGAEFVQPSKMTHWPLAGFEYGHQSSDWGSDRYDLVTTAPLDFIVTALMYTTVEDF